MVKSLFSAILVGNRKASLEAVEQVNAYADDLSTLFSSPLFSFPLRENLLRNAHCGMYTAEGLAHNNTVKGESFLKVCVIADYDRKQREKRGV